MRNVEVAASRQRHTGHDVTEVDPGTTIEDRRTVVIEGGDRLGTPPPTTPASTTRSWSSSPRPGTRRRHRCQTGARRRQRTRGLPDERRCRCALRITSSATSQAIASASRPPTGTIPCAWASRRRRRRSPRGSRHGRDHLPAQTPPRPSTPIPTATMSSRTCVRSGPARHRSDRQRGRRRRDPGERHQHAAHSGRPRHSGDRNETDAYSLRLTSQPSADVEVAILTDGLPTWTDRRYADHARRPSGDRRSPAVQPSAARITSPGRSSRAARAATWAASSTRASRRTGDPGRRTTNGGVTYTAYDRDRLRHRDYDHASRSPSLRTRQRSSSRHQPPGIAGFVGRQGQLHVGVDPDTSKSDLSHDPHRRHRLAGRRFPRRPAHPHHRRRQPRRLQDRDHPRHKRHQGRDDRVHAENIPTVVGRPGQRARHPHRGRGDLHRPDWYVTQERRTASRPVLRRAADPRGREGVPGLDAPALEAARPAGGRRRRHRRRPLAAGTASSCPARTDAPLFEIGPQPPEGADRRAEHLQRFQPGGSSPAR